MSWLAGPGRYQLFFNRDERHERKPATPPEVRHRSGVSYLAPADGDFGGSWIAVNEHGLSLCLLNGPALPGDGGLPTGDRPSRGRIPIDLAASRGPAEAAQALREAELERYRPFLLVALAPDGGMTGRWTGDRLELSLERPVDQPLVSSSFCTEEVRRNRISVFRKMQAADSGDAEAHLAYHRAHDPEEGPYSPCMHRPDACSVSFSWIAVDARQVSFRYQPSPPCRGEPGPAVTLPRGGE